jgi:hypothetical protein
MKLIVCLLAIIVCATVAIAEQENNRSGEEINWQVISSGGTDGGSTNFGLKGTVSQTSTGHGSSDNFGLSHGFWQLFGVGGPCQGECGDANYDLAVNVSDAVYIINYVFVGGGEPQPVLACGDANTDGAVNVSDAVYIINYVFVGGGPPGNCSPGSPNWYNGDCCPFTS